MTNAEFEASVKAIESEAKGMTPKRRNEATGELIERFVQARGEMPPERLLERLADVILYDDLSDTAKQRRGDRPALYRESQLMRQSVRQSKKAIDHEKS